MDASCAALYLHIAGAARADWQFRGRRLGSFAERDGPGSFEFGLRDRVILAARIGVAFHFRHAVDCLFGDVAGVDLWLSLYAPGFFE